MCDNKDGLTKQWILLNLSAVFVSSQVSSLTELSLWPQQLCDGSNREVMLCEGVAAIAGIYIGICHLWSHDLDNCPAI